MQKPVGGEVVELILTVSAYVALGSAGICVAFMVLVLAYGVIAYIVQRREE